MQRLFLFQIGPVQAFIAQARRTQDLFIGSHILSALAAAGLETARSTQGFQSVFPYVEAGNGVTGGVPHRFAFMSEDEPNEVAEAVKKAIDERWRAGFARPVQEFTRSLIGDGKWQSTFQAQVDPTLWMEFYYAAVLYSNHRESHHRVNLALAQRKNARFFPQVEESGPKCTLTGAQAVIEENRNWWITLRGNLNDPEGRIFRDNERLGGMALVKRLAAKAECVPNYEVYPSTRHIAADDSTLPEGSKIGGKEVTGYLAVLHMDGDKMGEYLSSLDRDELRDFSQRLARFASKEAKEVIEENYGGNTGRLVYSGGDDVLALLPLKHALKCAYELQVKFRETTGGRPISAGIAITPENLPLDRALEMAREAESLAKDKYGRAAVVFMEAHSSGQIREAGAKWDIVPFLESLQKLFEELVLSGKLGFDLLTFDREMFGAELRDARKAEAHRLAKRRTAEGVSDAVKTQIAGLVDSMTAYVEDRKMLTWTQMANWVILARFLAQGGRRES